MNSYIKVPFLLCILALASIIPACSDGFLTSTPEDRISLDAFYASNEQVDASTNILYGAPWFSFNDKFSWAVGEIMSGNGRSWSGDVVNFGNFAVSGDNQVLTSGWKSLWTVIAQANALINNLQDRAGPDVDQEAIDNALGEARVMRASAYFYLVRLWGPVPIIENNLDYVYSPQVPRNRVEDVYEFITRDLEFGIENCRQKIRGSNYANNAHISSGSAKALLAKVALYQKDYDKAKQLSEEVINSGEFKLLEPYADLFKTENNNNEESVIALQWSDEGYGTGNSMQAYFAYTTTITGTGDGWGVLGPTIDLQNAYETGDERRKATIMLAGDHYPGIRSSDGGFDVDDDVSAQGTKAAIKKYVVGTPDDNGGVGKNQATEISTYIMRYADVLLIHAESILRDAASTSDAAALDSFNKVRERAGLVGDISSITKDDILHERRKEFAIEGDYWYDLGRIDRSKAIDIISNQERGTYSSDDPPELYSEKYTPGEDDFLLPYPSVDVAVNENLTKDPVPYNFE